jgi:hypothetical protein
MSAAVSAVIVAEQYAWGMERRLDAHMLACIADIDTFAVCCPLSSVLLVLF